MRSRHVVLARRPQGLPVADDFQVVWRDLPLLQEGRLSVEVLFATCNPGSRNRLAGDASYARALRLGETMEGPAIGRVIDSRNPAFPVGTLVVGAFGWAEHAQTSGRGLRKIPQTPIALSAWAGVLGIPGLTAYFGLIDLARPQAGETVLVSSAAGPVGATAGQIAGILGCRTIGIASGRQRAEWLRTVAGFDTVVERQGYDSADSLQNRITEQAPNGIDVFFDNVGGPILDAAIACMRPRGRIVISGQLADYNRDGERYGTRRVGDFIAKRLRMEGLVVFDYEARFDEAIEALSAWIIGGRLHYHEHIVEGLERLPELFCAQLRGEVFGRPLARLAQ